MTKRNDETRCDSSERVEAWQLSRSVSLEAKRKGARRREMPPARRDRAKRSEAKNGAKEELSAELPKASRKLHVCACSGPQPAGGFSAETIPAGLAARRRLMSASGGPRTPESAGSKAEDGCHEQAQVLYSKATSEQQRKMRLRCGRNCALQNSRCYATSVTLQREAGCAPGKEKQAQVLGKL